MPIKVTYEEIINNSKPTKTIGEIHDNCDIIGVQEYKSNQTGKVSLKLTFKYDGIEFPSYMGITEKSIKITMNRLVRILTAAVGEEKTKELFFKLAEDEDVNTEQDLCIALAQKTNLKLKVNPVKAYVDRVKDGEFWNVKWKIEDKSIQPQKTEVAELTDEDFFNEVDA